MKQVELRFYNSEIRANEDGSMKVSGYVNKVEQLSEVLGSAKKFVEKIAKGAFDRAIKNTKTDIDFLAEHDTKQVLASTRNNSLSLREDNVGLYMEATIVPTSYGKDYYELINSGILRNMSFGFRTVKDYWKSGLNGIAERTIHELELFEVSAVKNPAYSQSTLSARGIDLVEDITIPNLKNEKEQLNKMKTEFRYNTKNEIEIRKENESREFNETLKGIATRDLQTTDYSGAVIPENVADQIVVKLEEVSPVFARAKKFYSTSGALKIPRENAVGVGMFVGEGENLIEDAMILGEVKLEQKRVGAALSLTNQLINDAAINMAEYVPSLLARRVYKAVEESILHGNTDESFRGIVHEEEVEAFVLSADVSLLDTLLDMTLNIHPEYLSKAQFIMSRPFFNRVSKLKDAVGHAYVQNGIINGKPTKTLFGLEVVISSALEDGDASGQTPLILGSIEDGYAVMVKKGATMTVVQDSKQALRGSQLFVFDSYMDGCVYNPDAFAKLVIA
ncbi:phage major capsid protein [Alteribacter aurantiacus]|uniref:phage major capsid protein n=1 Tax=Alteribacter aurantiacus TaxID=254410 RepID=UPI00041D0159|nr:phage major capsid protein [Alteribacter aurantiacus]